MKYNRVKLKNFFAGKILIASIVLSQSNISTQCHSHFEMTECTERMTRVKNLQNFENPNLKKYVN